MDLESTQNNALAKLPLLKQGDYDTWRLRIESYIQLQDYALWEIIEDGNSFKPVARTTTNADGTSTSTIPGVDAKTLFEAIEARFGGNEATKKTQKTLLKQMYENFNASSSESLDSLFNRLQKIVSQLSILGVNISQEDLNLKFLRCLPVEWNTHVVVWRNKPDLETMSIDDLYNNFKIVEQEVKGTVSTSQPQILEYVTFVSTPGIDSAVSLSDATVYAFLANQPYGSRIIHEDLEQIHDDDLEEMDLKWQLALLSMRAKKFYQRTGKKITINGGDTAGFDKTKVEWSRNQEITRRTVKVEEASPKAMLAVNGARFDWSFMAEEEVPTNMALMAFSDLEVQNRGLFVPLSINLSHSGIEKFKEPEFVGYGVKVDQIVSEISFVETKKTPDASIIEDWVSDCEEDEIVSLNHQIKDCDYHDKKMGQKPVLNKGKKGTGERESKLVWNDAMRTNHQNFSNNRRNLSPKAVLTKSGKVPISTARQSSPKAAVLISTAKPVNTAAPKSLMNVAKYRTNTKRVTSDVGKKGVNAVKPSACWVWRPKIKGIDHISKDSGSYICKRFDYVDPTGRLNSKGVKISGKGTIRTGNLDFKDMYFVKELKFNLFSVSQMCDKKNSVLFTETECLILSPDFKLPDENQVMLKIPKKDNMYSFDLKNIVPLKVVTNDYSRFSWVFLLAKKDETSGILRNFIAGIENQLNHKVKIIRSDNGTEFKNQDLNQFCNSKGIKREYSNARTPKQNRVAERKNMTLIEAARTMLAYSLLPIPFWAEAINTACYVQNKVLVTKPHNKTPYELLIGRPPIISFMRPFGCLVSILNTLDHLGKFDGKADEGVLVGYSISSKAFRVYNHRTRKVEENLHVNFLENQPNIAGNGPKWLFDIDSLTNTMNYHPVSAGNRANVNAGIETNSDAGQAEKEKVPDQEYILLPLLHTSSYGPSTSEEDVSSPNDDDAGKKVEQEPANVEDHTLKDAVNNMLNQEKMATKHSDDGRSQFEEECDAQLCKGMRTRTSSTNSFNTVRTPLNTASASRTSYPAGTSSEPQLMPIDGSFSIDINDYPDDPLMPELEDTAEIHSTGIFGSAYDDSLNTPVDDQSVGAEADFNNMEPSINVSHIPTTRIHSIHPKDQIIGDPKSAVQTRIMAKKSKAGLVSFINKQRRTNHKDF
ncbi:ribonuclease H-like domain-containing protein, partial [Tanacetum coccineum]